LSQKKANTGFIKYNKKYKKVKICPKTS